jgi:transposase
LITIDNEQRVDVLRQVALLLKKENDRLTERVERLTRELAAAKGVGTEQLRLELEELHALLARRDQEIFGDSSEKRKHTCGDSAAKRPAPGHGPTEQKQLAIIEQVHVLDDADRPCPACGGHLVEMEGQFEESEEVTVVERHFVVTKHKRTKYRCRCNGHIETAPGPVKLQEGGRYSPDFAVEVAASKYLDHLPLERQVRIMAREGLDVTSQTLWDQTEAMARHLRPTYEAIRAEIFHSPVVGADETYWRVMGHKDEKKRWWAWCLSSPAGVFFRILDSRGEASGAAVLTGYSGVVIADGYTVYDAIARGDPGLTVANCWAHVRRKYLEVEESFPSACKTVLDLIGELYAVERSVRDSVSATADDEYRHQLAEARAVRSKEILGRIQKWATEQRVLPQSGLGQAIRYMIRLWKGLTAFVGNPHIPLDNNETERALRGPVVGRKNFYGARSRRGTEVAALFYTLIETAKVRAVEPKDYLRRALYAAIAAPGAITLP